MEQVSFLVIEHTSNPRFESDAIGSASLPASGCAPQPERCYAAIKVMRHSKSELLLALAFLVPTRAFAEVMDKEPPIGAYWLVALVISTIGFFTCKKWPWLGVVVLVASYGILTEVLDPVVGPAIRNEAGLGYVIQVYLCSLLTVSASVGGIVMHFRKKRIKGKAA